MGQKIGLSFDFELDEGEKILQETPTIIDVEFEKQEDFFQTICGKENQRKSFCQAIPHQPTNLDVATSRSLRNR